MAKTNTRNPKSDSTQKAQGNEEQSPQFALGVVPDLIEMESYGYVQQRADVQIPKTSREAIKRLAMTLDARNERLSNGTLVKNSIPKAIAWLVEKFGQSISQIENQNSEK